MHHKLFLYAFFFALERRHTCKFLILCETFRSLRYIAMDGVVVVKVRDCIIKKREKRTLRCLLMDCAVHKCTAISKRDKNLITSILSPHTRYIHSSDTIDIVCSFVLCSHPDANDLWGLTLESVRDFRMSHILIFHG